MRKSRREFLAPPPPPPPRSWPASRPKRRAPPPATTARRRDAARVRDRPARGARDHAGDDRRGREARPRRAHAEGPGAGRGQLARRDGRHDGAAHGAAEGRARALARAGLAAGTRSSPAARRGPARGVFARSKADPGPLPKRDEDIAFAPVTALSRWIESKALTSERLTDIYLDRLRALRPAAQVRHHAHARARARAGAAGRRGDRGREIPRPAPRHPVGRRRTSSTPKGIRTTWGAEPYRDRVPDADAFVVRAAARGGRRARREAEPRRARAERRLVRRPDEEPVAARGRRGRVSSAGPGAATAAGLVGFAIGSETEGCIIAPSMRCGVTGLRPTFGRVAAHGRDDALLVAWTSSGPMARGVEDTLLVLAAISGPDPGDVSSVPSRLDFEADGARRGAAGRVLPGVDEGGPRPTSTAPRSGPRSASGWRRSR